jgi:hypothetical protein
MPHSGPTSLPPSTYQEENHNISGSSFNGSMLQPPSADFHYQQQQQHQQQQHDYLLGGAAPSAGGGSTSSSSVFDPFGSSLLVAPQQHLSSGSLPSVGASQLTTAFPSLSLGPSLLQQQELGQQQHHQQQQFGGNPGSPPGMSSFSRGISSDGTNVGAAVFQPSAGSIGGGSIGGGYGLVSPPPSQHQRHSLDLGASLLSPQPFSSSLGVGGYGGAASPGGTTAGGGEMYDDWGDLQLQLPSDLGEILGDDPPLMMMSSPQQQQQLPSMQQQQQQQGMGGGLYGSGNGGGSGLGAPPGWGAF